jgi:hypothetical protein
MLYGASSEAAVSARGPDRYPIPVPSFGFLKSMISTEPFFSNQLLATYG